MIFCESVAPPVRFAYFAVTDFVGRCIFIPYWLSAVFAFLAVPGVYYIFCVLIGGIFSKHSYSVMICGDGYSPQEIILEVRSAQMYLEGKRRFSQFPVVGFRQLPDAETLAFFRENGIIYTKIYEKEQ